MPRSSAATPVERFFTRSARPDALIRQLKADAKASGRDPKAIQVAIGTKLVPLAKLEKDLDAMWKDRFDPGPLGRGESFRPRFERDFFDSSLMKLSFRSSQRLGRLADGAVKEIRFSDPSRLATLQPTRTHPGLLRFLARSCELNTTNATWAGPALRAFFQQPLDLAGMRVDRTSDADLAQAWLRAAQAVDLDPSQIQVRAMGGQVVPLSVLSRYLARSAHDRSVSEARGLVHDPSLPWDVPGSPDAGPMVFDYGTAPGYGGGTGGYFPDPPPRPRSREPIRVAPPPPDVVLPPRLAPPPKDVRVPPGPQPVRPAPAPPAASGGVVFTPPPPPPPPAGRPLISTPWEIVATPGAPAFFEAKARGYDGSWEDWKHR